MTLGRKGGEWKEQEMASVGVGKIFVSWFESWHHGCVHCSKTRTVMNCTCFCMNIIL